MSIVNYTYGVLTGGIVDASSPWYRNSINVSYTCDKQRDVIKSLWGSSRSPEAIACSTDMLLKLLQCSEHYPRYIQDYDKLNTYTTAVGRGELPPEGCLSFDELMRWTNNLDVRSDRFVVNTSQINIVNITNALYSVLTLRG
jgi:hypothetical protein